jgi:hypothetical protein
VTFGARAFLCGFAAICALAGVSFFRPHSTPGPPMRDFEAYYAAGAAWNAGENPYGTAIWKAERRLDASAAAKNALLPFAGPPLLLPLYGAVARLPFGAANALWRAFLVLCTLALALAALRAARLPRTAFSFVAIGIAALGCGPLTSAVALGQIALPACTFAVIALTVPASGFFAWVQPNLAAVLISQWNRLGAMVWWIAGGAAFVAAGGAQYLHVLAALATAERFAAIQLTPAAIAYGLGWGSRASQIAGWIVAGAAVLIWLLLVRRERGAAVRFCIASALLPLALPFAHEHDLAIAFFPAIYVTARCAPRLWPLAAAGALMLFTDWLGLAQRPDGALQTVLLAAAAGIALFALRDDLRARTLLVVPALCGAIALAAVAAARHPAPVWPDAMPPVARYFLGAAQAWHAEQVATGLLARNVTWASLRALSLFGCVPLAWSAATLSDVDRPEAVERRYAVGVKIP